MGIGRWWISALSVAAVGAMLVYVDDPCAVDCDQSISASGTTTTTESASDPLPDNEVRETLRVAGDIDLRNFASQRNDEGESTATTEGGGTTTSSIAEPSEAAEGSADADDGATGNENADSDGDAGGTSTTTSTTAAPSAPAPSPVNSNVPVNGSKIYVDPNGGNDSNDGASESQALKSFQNALRRVRAGQTVYLMSGEYRELQDPGALHYFLHSSGSPGAWIRIANAPGHNPVIVATGGTGLVIEADYIEVSGIAVRGEGFAGKNDPWGVGIAIADSHHVRVLNSRISGMPVSGISANRSSNVHLINNVVYENSFWNSVSGSGISFFEQRNHGQGPDYGQYHDVVIGNRVFRNENKVNSRFQAAKGITVKTDGNGIIIDSNNDSGYSGRTLVANNLSYDNGGRGILAYASSRVDILFNTTYHNVRTDGLLGEGAELAAGKGNDVRIEHNVAWARPGKLALTMSGNSNSSTKGNVLVTSRSDSYAGASDTTTTGNPGLRNPSVNGGSADFRPSPGGGLIGRATHTGTVPRDIVGTARGGGVEPGAFEAEASTGR